MDSSFPIYPQDTQIGLSYDAESHYLPQPAFAPYNAELAVDSALRTQFQSVQFTLDPSYNPQTFDPSPAIHGHENHGVGPMSDVQTTPATPMGPPTTKPRKRKAPTLRAEDWEPYKSRILELHIAQGIPLPEVKKTLEQERGFTAEIRQYRTRISQWGKDKNVKSQEMSAIVRKRQRRKLVEINKGELAFKVRDVSVEPQKIDRWMKRHEVLESQLYAPSPDASTPSDVYCQTISERGSPAFISGFSPAASINSPGPFYSTAQSPQISSPALSISSLVRPQSSAFAGQSPAPIYRSLSYDSPSSFSTVSGFHGNLETTTSSSQYRYKQKEEEHLRGELLRAESEFGTSHPKTLDILSNLSIILIDQGRYKSAEEAVRRELEGRQFIEGHEGANTLSALNGLGLVLTSQGRYESAEKVHRRTLASRKTILGLEHPDTLTSRGNLAAVLFYIGKYEDAERMQREVVVLRKRILGQEHPDTLKSIHSLAYSLIGQEKYAEAEHMYREVLVARVKVLGKEHLDTLVNMTNLARVVGLQGKYTEAEHMYREALLLKEKVLGKEHPDSLISMHNLANVYQDQKRWTEAEQLLLQVIEASKRVLGEEHPDTLISMHNLANVYQDQKRWTEAEQLRLQVIEAKRRVFGEDHPETKISVKALESGMRESGHNMG